MNIRDREVTKNILVTTTFTQSGKALSLWDLALPDRERGVNGAGFHYAIQPNGSILSLRPDTKWGNFKPAWEKYNHDSILIKVVGQSDSFTEKQEQALSNLLDRLAVKFPDSLPWYRY